MRYSFLGQDLHETADRAKSFFAANYGATHFKCEEPVENDLRLRPTWKAKLKSGHTLCVNVQPTPFSSTLYEFVMKCAQRELPIKLWVAVPLGSAKESFSADLKQAHEAGIGVVQFSDDGKPHEFHRAVPLSLFGLKKTDLRTVPRARRDEVKTAEATFLDGTPDQGCQALCQQLEQITRQVAERTYDNGWWKTPAGSKPLRKRFFTTDSWAKMLEAFDSRVEQKKVEARCPSFTKAKVAGTRGFTDWRNDVSHKPKNLKELQKRDAKLRTMFEATRNLLIEWYLIAKPLKLL
jgi:hypothetical protein